jgi:predicted dehydrogenase
VLQPAAEVDRVDVVAVAARDKDRAEAFAREHGVPSVAASYEALIGRDDVDAIYIGLPPAGHAEWTIAALEAGKHVLCEKPFSCDVAEADAMVSAATAARRVLCEAHHWRYHPLAARLREVLRSGRIGAVTAIEAEFSAPIRDETDIRHQLELGGGALMDLGCYPIQWARFVAESEPAVVAARAVEGRPGIDLSMDVELAFPPGVQGLGVKGIVRTSMAPDTPVTISLRVTGDEGSLVVYNPLAPSMGHLLRVVDPDGTKHDEQVAGRSTYAHQLEAFVSAALDGAVLPTGGEDAVATMRVLEAAYGAAGLPRRGLAPSPAAQLT